MERIVVEKLTEESFAPFGKVITIQGRTYGGEEGLYRWYAQQAVVDDAAQVSVNLLTAISKRYVFRRFEAHARTTETLLPLTGGVIVAGIPAGEVTPERVRAFYVPVGMGISWAPGAWHYAPYPVGEESTCAVIFREGTGADDAVFENLPEEMGFSFQEEQSSTQKK